MGGKKNRNWLGKLSKVLPDDLLNAVNTTQTTIPTAIIAETNELLYRTEL